MTTLNAYNIANLIFERLVNTEELIVNDEDWDPIMQIKVKLNLTKPLSKGFYNHKPGKEEWVQFKYKRLPAFLFMVWFLRLPN